MRQLKFRYVYLKCIRGPRKSSEESPQGPGGMWPIIYVGIGRDEEVDRQENIEKAALIHTCRTNLHGFCPEENA